MYEFVEEDGKTYCVTTREGVTHRLEVLALTEEEFNSMTDKPDKKWKTLTDAVEIPGLDETLAELERTKHHMRTLAVSKWFEYHIRPDRRKLRLLIRIHQQFTSWRGWGKRKKKWDKKSKSDKARSSLNRFNKFK